MLQLSRVWACCNPGLSLDEWFEDDTMGDVREWCWGLVHGYCITLCCAELSCAVVCCGAGMPTPTPCA
jgi:hypothetical protein